ncbi:MAG: hypothetical protein IPI67_09405 [Myxococcales bacterium]|nr:hypothetical protein [Myxococcales bacterium]
MNDLDRQLRARIDAFVADIGELVRRAALDAVSEALGGARTRQPATTRPKAGGKRRGRGAKRSASELETLSAAIARRVAEHPGEGAREIAAALELTSKDLVLPMKKLVETGVLTTKGQKRATKYFRGKR